MKFNKERKERQKMFEKSIMRAAMMALCLTLTTIVCAEETQKIPQWADAFEGFLQEGTVKDINWDEIAKRGTNGQVFVFVENGSPVIYVIGRGPIIETLDPVDAEQEADDEAEFDAKKTLALWLAENFTIKQVRGKNSLTIKNNQNKNGRESKTTASEVTLIKKENVERSASVHFRGMRKYNAKRTKTEFIAVWRWSLTEQKLAEFIETIMQNGNVDSGKRQVECVDWEHK